VRIVPILIIHMAHYRIPDEELTPFHTNAENYLARPEVRERRNRQARERRKREREEEKKMLETERGREIILALKKVAKEKAHLYYLRNQERIKKNNLEYYYKHKNNK